MTFVCSLPRACRLSISRTIVEVLHLKNRSRYPAFCIRAFGEAHAPNLSNTSPGDW